MISQITARPQYTVLFICLFVNVSFSRYNYAVSLAMQLARPLLQGYPIPLGTMPGIQAAWLLLTSKACHQEIVEREAAVT
jgi:hypothetical protein